MPYIPQEQRNVHTRQHPQSPGQLNWAITELIREYLDHKGSSYGVYNEVIGMLECCKLELYRRVIANYEDSKCELNGDVYC